MKKYLLLLAFLPFALQAQTTWYVSPTGNDGTGVGTLAQPWRTFYKASTEVTDAGDKLYAFNGTYNEVQQSQFAVGISIEGESMGNVIINSTYAASNQPLWKLETSNGWLGT